MPELLLLDHAGATATAALRSAPDFAKPVAPLRSRRIYAAAHVIPRVAGENVPGAPADIDWETTLAFRRHIWSWGLGVADAMDTAQRNMGLDADATRELISRSAAEADSVKGALVVGVSTDHVEDEALSIEEIIDAYSEQLHFAEDVGAGVVLMASRHLARAARDAADYRRVYREVLARAGAPVILHWLGTAFDPALAGYFGSTSIVTASDTVLSIIEENADRVAGIKMSLLDADAEIALRARLPRGVSLYTGDDFHYAELILGEPDAAVPGQADRRLTGPARHSDALLGAFAVVAPQASAAVQALDAGRPDEFRRILEPTQALSRQVFAEPTFYYKTGVAFLSWLNGHQPAFSMVGGLHCARSLPHLSDIVRLANECGALERPELAASRWHGLLALNGVGS